MRAVAMVFTPENKFLQLESCECCCGCNCLKKTVSCHPKMQLHPSLLKCLLRMLHQAQPCACFWSFVHGDSAGGPSSPTLSPVLSSIETAARRVVESLWQCQHWWDPRARDRCKNLHAVFSFIFVRHVGPQKMAHVKSVDPEMTDSFSKLTEFRSNS